MCSHPVLVKRGGVGVHHPLATLQFDVLKSFPASV